MSDGKKKKAVMEPVPTWVQNDHLVDVERYLAIQAHESSNKESTYEHDQLASWEPDCTRIGYIRVSTPYQSLLKQVVYCMHRKCEKIYFDRESGRSMDRPGWLAAKADLRQGDTLVSPQLDRVGRTTIDILNEVAALTTRGVRVEIGDLGLDMDSSATQEALFGLLAVIASLEVRLKDERQREQREAKLAAGLQYGRQPKLSPAVRKALWERRQEGISYAKLAKEFGVSKSSVPNYLAMHEETMTAKALEEFRGEAA
jgi:DNA invertase Pin-like site-specific DNA recombinase